MTNKTLLSEAMKMPPAKRKAFANRLLDSLDEDSGPEISPKLKSEVDRRLATIKKDPARGIPWNEAMKKLDAELKAIKGGDVPDSCSA
jgi:putative addiction module component (TIGR02574 family)